MPVILPEKNFEKWLDPNYDDIESLKTLLIPYSDKEMIVYHVSNYVSNARNQGKECLEPLKE
jgi:putative SOS response-associated peptidase YedK